MKTIWSIFLSIALAITMMPAIGGLASPAFAGEDDAALQELADNMQHGNAAFNFTSEKSHKKGAMGSDGLPTKYDLRDLGYVTPVKSQSPYGTCWGFSAIAAAESSLLSSGIAKPEDMDETGTLNLSEKHLTYFTYQSIDDPEDSQFGEGRQFDKSATVQDHYNQGGFIVTATSVFSSGIGPNLENRAYPDEPGTNMKDVLGYFGKNKNVNRVKQQKMVNGEPVLKWEDVGYSATDDWSIDHNYRYLQSYVLTESNILPSPAKFTKDKNGKLHYEYNEEATKVLKKELMAGRAISVGFKADTTMPGETKDGKLISRNWAHYTNTPEEDPNHAVTIVGWDDTYSAANFIEGQQPPADGAWLVKNSWGSDEESFPNIGYGGWGIEKTDAAGNKVLDENGNTIHTGYFWLSYYDQSITIPETFEFDRSNVGKSYFLSQYDKMPVDDVAASRISSPAKMANVFYTEDAMNLEQVSCQTTYPGTKVTYNIYLLPDNYKSPDDGYLAESIQKTYEYGGFHKATLDKPLRIQPQQSYAVEVVQEIGGKYCISLQKGMNKKTAKAEGMRFWSKAVMNKGESFISINGKYQDLANEKLKKTLLGKEYYECVIDNLPIKAFGKTADSNLKLEVDELTQVLGAENEKDYLYLSLSGTSDSAKDAKASWVSLNPEIAEVAAFENNDCVGLITPKKLGVANVTASIEGLGTTIAKVYVAPPANEVLKLKPGKKGSLKVTFTDQKKLGIDGYEVIYRIKDKGEWKRKTVSKSRPSVMLKKLKKGKQYQVRVRSFKRTSERTIFGNFGKTAVSKKIK